MSNREDSFMQFAKAMEAAAQKTPGRSGSTAQRDYVDIKWCGLEANEDKIVRLVGNAPNYEGNCPTDSKVVAASTIVADDGRQMRVIRPCVTLQYAGSGFNPDPQHIITRIIQAVKKTRGYGKDKVFVVEQEHPDIFNIVTKNGLQPSDKRYQPDRGWEGRVVHICNVIDRSDMPWHRENKHTMLLSRNVSEKNGNTYAEVGVPIYGFLDKIGAKATVYGPWETFDLAIRRTGQMQNPYQICVASRVPEEVQADKRQYISDAKDLTEEEKSWERYDIEKLFKPTSYTKLFNRLQNTIKRIDVALGTRFYEELRELSEKEKAEWEANAEETKEVPTAPATAPAPIQMNEAEESVFLEPPAKQAPARPRVASSGVDWSLLPHHEALSPEQKAIVKYVERDKFGNLKIGYNTSEIIYNCVENCGCTVPESFLVCPNCGSKQL